MMGGAIKSSLYSDFFTLRLFQMDRFKRERRADLWKLICGIAVGLAIGAAGLMIAGLAVYFYFPNLLTR